MQNIIHVIPRLGNGGAEKLILATAPHYIRQNINIKIICLTDESEISHQLRSKNIKVESIFGKGRMFDASSIKKLYEILKKENPDIIISHLLMANFFSFIVTLLLGIKHIPMMHNLNVENSVFDNCLNFIIKLFSFRVLCVSNAVKDYEDAFCPRLIKNKTRVLYNAIDSSFFLKSINNKNFTQKNNEFNFICSGRLVSQKRHKDLIKAFSKSKFLNQSKLTILGDGPLYDDLEKLIKDLNISKRCALKGHVNNVAEYLDNADAFIYPSEREGNPLALIEALARNLPVILSDIDCHLELFSKEKNIFFKTGNVVSLRDKIDEFCKDNVAYFENNSMSDEDLISFRPEKYVTNMLEAIK